MAFHVLRIHRKVFDFNEHLLMRRRTFAKYTERTNWLI